jgi:hypothetical protein
MILMKGWAAWSGGDLQEGLNGHGLGGPGVDLQLEGLEKQVCRRKQMTHNLAEDGHCCRGVKIQVQWMVYQCKQLRKLTSLGKLERRKI